MCGIAGIWKFGTAIDRQELEQFTKSVLHRGPDGWHVHIDKDLGLGHTRLAILDLSERGRCPMFYKAPSGREYWITFNGEIFNFLELRGELEKLGHHFLSDSDTEVIAAAYDQWGEACLLRFNGMWAFALWCATDRTLLLARDRFGVKPLYYYAGQELAFASELKAFLNLKNFTPALEESVVPLLLQYQRYDGRTDQSMMKGVRTLAGGCLLRVKSSGEAYLGRWWNTHDHLPSVPSGYEEQVEQFRDLFLDAVRIRMRSDVPVGTCLSGGVDSSAVAASMAHLMNSKDQNLTRCQKEWQKSFVACFPGSANDERVFADTVIKAIGADPYYWNFDSDDATQYLLDSQWSLDEPSSGYAVPVWCLYRELRKQRVVVSLDGHGGDELLAGYPWYLDWITKDVNENLYNDFHSLLLPTILRNYDRSSAAHGIEVRMPLMDWRLVTYSFALPPSTKLGGGYTKRILRDSMKGIVPESIRTRRSKIGFNVPITDWFNNGLVPLLERVMNHRVWLQSPFFPGAQLRDQVLGMSRAKAWKLEHWDTVYQVSKMLNLALWQILFVEQARKEIE